MIAIELATIPRMTSTFSMRYIVSGASTPIKSRQRAITDCVAVHEAEAERLRLGAEHLVVVVEAVEVVGDADRVGRDRVRAAALGRLGDDRGKLGEPLDQVALLGGELGGRLGGRDVASPGVPEDPGDPGVRVLDVVDGVLLALFSAARSTSISIVWSGPR